MFGGTVGGKRPGYRYSYRWNFGESGGWETRSLGPGHTYFDNGHHPVILRVLESDGAGRQTRSVDSAPLTVNLQNLAPTGNISGAPASSPEGTEIVLQSTIDDPGKLDRPGLVRAWSVSGGSFEVTGSAGMASPRFSFRPTDSGTYVVTLAVTDKDGATTRINKSVTIRNVAPTARTGGPYVAATGRRLFVVGAIGDASASDAANAQVSWDFGDGSAPVEGLEASHVYPASVPLGRKTLTMTVADNDGGVSTVTTWVTLDNAPWFSSPKGVYVLSDLDGWLSQTALEHPSVDGVSLRLRWSSVEPEDGVYDWTVLDSYVDRAQAAGKSIGLYLSAGVNTPDWVYDAGAVRFDFMDDQAQASIPVPWDPVFLDRWTDFIGVVGERYSSRAALVQVKITGVQHKSAETGLPFSDDDLTNWLQVRNAAGGPDGYTRVKVFNAWKRIVRAFSDAFPFQKTSGAFAPHHFPRIDDNGHEFQSSSGGDGVLADNMIAHGIDVYGPYQGAADQNNVRFHQFAAQNNGLSKTWIAADVANASNQVDTGHQMLWAVSNDPNGRMNGGVPYSTGAAASVLQAAVNRGVSGGARFLEFYAIDIAAPNLQGVIAQAHTTLHSLSWRR